MAAVSILPLESARIAGAEAEEKVVSIQILDRPSTTDVAMMRRSPAAAITGKLMDDQDYQVPFKFIGTIDKLTLNLQPKLISRTSEQAYPMDAGAPGSRLGVQLSLFRLDRYRSPGLVRLVGTVSSGDLWSSWPKILLVDNTGLVHEEGHYAGRSVIGRPRN